MFTLVKLRRFPPRYKTLKPLVAAYDELICKFIKFMQKQKIKYFLTFTQLLNIPSFKSSDLHTFLVIFLQKRQ